MSNNFPTRAGVESAEPLEFSAKPQSSIAIHATFNGWPVTITFTGKLEQLPSYLERVSAAGLQPAATQAAQAAPRAKRETVEPFYKPDGTPCCPKHQKPLKQGQYGLYCSAKDPEGKNGYCSLRFN
jgi:hypothetical protein